MDGNLENKKKITLQPTVTIRLNLKERMYYLFKNYKNVLHYTKF